MSLWPDLAPEEHHHPARATVLSVAVATLGGTVGWALFFVGLRLWGLAIGAAVVGLVSAVVGRVDAAQRVGEAVIISLACCLLAWPPLALFGLFVDYWITGNSIGS